MIDWLHLALVVAVFGALAVRACRCRTAPRRVVALVCLAALVAALAGGWLTPWLDRHAIAILLAAFAITLIALPALLFGRLLSSLLAALSGLGRQ